MDQKREHIVPIPPKGYRIQYKRVRKSAQTETANYQQTLEMSACVMCNFTTYCQQYCKKEKGLSHTDSCLHGQGLECLNQPLDLVEPQELNNLTPPIYLTLHGDVPVTPPNSVDTYNPVNPD